MESKRRSLLKAVSYRLFGSLFTFIISYALTNNITVAGGISFLDLFGKIFLYYIHERAWNKIR